MMGTVSVFLVLMVAAIAALVLYVAHKLRRIYFHLYKIEDRIEALGMREIPKT